MRRRLALCAAVLQCAISSGLPHNAKAQDFSTRLGEVERQLHTLAERLSLLYTTHVRPEEGQGGYLLEHRLADGQLMFVLGDYLRAAVIFMDIVESSENPRSLTYRDALYRLSESLFLSGNLVGARGFYQELLEDSDLDRRLGALKRLLEIAFTTRHYEDLPELYARLDREPAARTRSDIQYIRGKTLYFQEDYRGALSEFADVGREAPEFPQAQYFLGVCYVRLEDWDSAIGAFETARAAVEEGVFEDEGLVEIGNLANLALGRVYYEMDDTERARDAYQAVSRFSAHYDHALYEMTWTYIQEQRFADALRTLEILLLAVPDSRFRPNAQLLQGDLLMRMAEYNEALAIFDTTVQQFSPLASQLASVFDEANRPGSYFDALIDSASASLNLPDLAREWVESDEEVQRALALVRELEAQSREIEESREIIADLEAVLNSPSRLDVAPELREGYGRALETTHGTMRLAAELVDLEAELVMPHAGADERGRYEQWRADRSSLEEELNALPSTYEQMRTQEEAMESEIWELEMELFRQGYEIDTQYAQLRALRMQVREDAAAGRRTAAEAELLERELAGFQSELDALEAERHAMRVQYERQRLATGLSTVAGATQEELIVRYMAALDEETRLFAPLRSSLSAEDADKVALIDRARERLHRLRGDLDDFFQAVDRLIDERTRDFRQQLATESAMIDDYERSLRRYGDRGERLAGEIAFQNFIDVQNQFNDLILRADVGIIDVAWREKEDRSTRIESLFDERSESLNVFDTEFREVLEVE